VEIGNHFDIIFEASELSQLFLKVFKLWLLAIELFQAIIDLSTPEPVELSETLEEFLDVVFCSLDGTGEKQNDLHNLLVFGNPVIEWFSLVF